MKKLVIFIFMMIFEGVFISPCIAEIRYEGSSTIAKFMYEAITVYKESNFKIITDTESEGGETSVVEGRADIGGVAREVSQSVLDQGVKATLIGRDGIAIITNISNSINNLTMAQVKKIFTGKIKNWSEVDEPNLPIDVFYMAPISATHLVFKNVVLDGENYAGKVISPDRRIIGWVRREEHKGSIAHISFSFLDSVKPKIKRIRINNENPSLENINYPITRPLYLVTKGQPEGEVKKFIDWVLSPTGQAILKKRFLGVK
ncbi:MAG: phosphate ABC transporter substrate-binding protein [Proteobacteria bacterium]|nr:phosphate ABC transporter substrate-binding protein [Pseudomonadota bacterium]